MAGNWIAAPKTFEDIVEKAHVRVAELRGIDALEDWLLAGGASCSLIWVICNKLRLPSTSTFVIQNSYSGTTILISTFSYFKKHRFYKL